MSSQIKNIFMHYKNIHHYGYRFIEELECLLETDHGSRPYGDVSYIYIVLCIGFNLGLKFGRERPIRFLSPRFADPKIRN